MRTKLSSKLGTIAAAAAASSLLAACVSAAPLGSDGSDVSESKLQQRAAFALNTSVDKVSISKQKREGVRTNFIATVAGHRLHQCYVTSAGGHVSDAICSGAYGVGRGKANTKGGTCNALLSAAGRC